MNEHLLRRGVAPGARTRRTRRLPAWASALALLLFVGACGGGGGGGDGPAPASTALVVTGPWGLQTTRTSTACLGSPIIVQRGYDAIVVQAGASITVLIEGTPLHGSLSATGGAFTGTIPDGTEYLTLTAQFATACGGAALDGTLSWSSSNAPSGSPVICSGTGTIAGDRDVAPEVVGFSPIVAPFDPATGHQDPVLTDPFLTTSVEPGSEGRVVIDFGAGTRIDETSIFLGGNPAFGLDLSAVQFLHLTPGIGFEVVPLSSAAVDCGRITLVPEDVGTGGPGLAAGQYMVGVFAWVRNVMGQQTERPTFQAFTVGSADTTPPMLVTTNPVNQQFGVNPSYASVVIRFSESIASASVTSQSVRVEDASTPTPTLLPPAAGYPRLLTVADGRALPDDGFTVQWQGASVFPSQHVIQVTLVGLDTDPTGTTVVRDLSGNPLATTTVVQFITR